MEDKIIGSKDHKDTKYILEPCSPVVGRVMSNCHSFVDEETVKSILDLRQKTELRFGEIILLLLYDLKLQVTPGYFMNLYYAARKLEYFYDYFVEDITLEALETFLESSSKSKKYRCKSIFKRAIDYLDNTKEDNPYLVLKRKQYKIRKLEILNGRDLGITKAQAIMLDYKSFDCKETIEYIEGLKEKKNLKFAEVLLLILFHKKQLVKDKYFLVLFYAGQKLEPFYNFYLCDIVKDDVNKLINSLSAYLKGFCYSLYRQIRAYPQYDLVQESGSYKTYVSKISFKKNYECPDNIRFETFFKYWLFSNWDLYSMAFLRDCYCAFTKLETLKGIPMKQIRPSHIMRSIQNLGANQKNSVIRFYRLLDKFAYEKEIIQKRYASSLHLYVLKSNDTKIFLDDDVKELLRNQGEISVDITLVFLYTGIALREISNIRLDNFKDYFLHIRVGNSKSSRRKIPIHRDIKESFSSVIKYMEAFYKNQVSQTNQKLSIRRMIIEATEKYCSQKYTPLDCRRSFTNQLLSTGASRATVEKLRGTQYKLLYQHDLIYIHQSPDRLVKAIHNLSWGGGCCDDDLSDAI